MPESFIFYRSFIEAAEKIPEKYQIQFIKSIIFYALDGVEPDFSAIPNALKPLFEMAMIGIRPNINAAQRRREANSINGKKGGAPKGNKNAQKQPKTTEKQPKTSENNPIQPKTTENKPNVNVNENVNANANLQFSFINIKENCSASAVGEVGVSASPPPKHYGGLTEEEYKLAKELMPYYE